MKSLSRFFLIFVLLCSAAFGFSACGKEEKIHEGKTEAVYLDVGSMKYQVQISRQLNASSAEDRAYLQGAEKLGTTLTSDDEWFGVFLRVENTSKKPVKLVKPEQFSIVDTEDETFKPVYLWTVETNPFAYRAKELAGKEIFPSPNSPAGETPIQGSLLLFKLPRAATENRPLKLVIPSPEGSGEEASVNLDI